MNSNRFHRIAPGEWLVFTTAGTCQILSRIDRSRHMVSTPWGQEEHESSNDSREALGKYVDEDLEAAE